MGWPETGWAEVPVAAAPERRPAGPLEAPAAGVAAAAGVAPAVPLEDAPAAAFCFSIVQSNV